MLPLLLLPWCFDIDWDDGEAAAAAFGEEQG